jgi:hypothetical protein
MHKPQPKIATHVVFAMGEEATSPLDMILPPYNGIVTPIPTRHGATTSVLFQHQKAHGFAKKNAKPDNICVFRARF